MQYRRLFALTSLMVATSCTTRLVPVSNSVDTSHIDFSKASEMRTGQSCQDFVLGFIPVGDEMSLFDAIKQAGIRRVTVVEYEVSSYVVFAEKCVVVYGDNEAPVAPAPVAPPPIATPAPAPVAVPDPPE